MSTVGQQFTFNYTGAVQTWTCPSDVTSIKIECYGAGGAANPGKGRGGYSVGQKIVSLNQLYYIYIGGAGNNSSWNNNVIIGGVGGWNGGGNGSNGQAANYIGGAGGGGATDVRLGGTALSNRIIVAGGGGGTGSNGNDPGNGGGISGGTSLGGGGGTQSSGYSLGTGGNGVNYACGGGGGGYFGGFGGSGNFVSGGGGSGYIGGVTSGITTMGAGSSNNTNGKCIITVLTLVISVTNITLNKTIDTILISNTDTLIATISPSNAVNQTLTWTSSNTNIATVNSSGLVTGKSSGTCIITAKSTDGSNIISTCNITIIGEPIFSGNLSLSSIHNSDIQLSGNITNLNATIQYKISVNGIQIYPEIGYTDLIDGSININYTIGNNLLTLLTNTVTIDCMNSYGLTSANSYNVSLYNNKPIGILTSSNTTIHGDNIIINGSLTDEDLDQISYRILLNYVELQTWNNFAIYPTINYIITNNLLNIGDNTITIEYKDNFKNSLTNVWTQIIIKTNNTSIINIQYINGSVIGNIIDPDSDLTQYKILINGIQKYPINDYTDFNMNSTVNYQINRNDILIGKDNIVTIIAKDNFNSEISQEISFIGEYIGLIFMDETKQYYTTDIGELLKYLDFGTITLGQITEPIKVLIQNKYGFAIKDINLYVNNSLPNISIEFSKEENPFIATENLLLEKEYRINEIDYFYIRLNSSISSESVNGTFKISAKSTPLI